MNNILNGKRTESQEPEVLPSPSQLNLTEDQLSNIIANLLSSRDQRDLLIIEYILKANIDEQRSVRVEDLMKYLHLSNPSVAVRLKKMRESTIGDTPFPLLKTIKTGNALWHYFTDVIDREKALMITQLLMTRKNVSYEKYAAEKGISLENDSTKELQYGQEIETADEDENEDNYLENNNSEMSSENIDEEMQHSTESWNEDRQGFEKINFNDLSSQTVTMGEVLEMLDETTNALIEDCTKVMTQILEEKITELSNRIAELETKISSPQTSMNTQESADELSARVRMLVRQKIFSKKLKYSDPI